MCSQYYGGGEVVKNLLSRGCQNLNVSPPLCAELCTKAVPLKGSSHDMTSSAFDCLEISTCVCVPSLRHTSLFRPSQYDSHLHINSLMRIHRFFFGSGPKTFTLIFITWLLWHMSFQTSHISVIMQMRWNITPLQQMARDDNNGSTEEIQCPWLYRHGNNNLKYM